jgi:hypothetical protein
MKMSDVSNKQLMFLGLLLLLLSFGGYFLAYVNYSEPEQSNDIRQIGVTAMSQCNQNIRNQYGNGYQLLNGYNVRYLINNNAQDMSVTVSARDLRGGMNVVKDMDIMMNMCPKMRLDYFCMGGACESDSLPATGGMEMRLIFNMPREI